MAKLNSYFRNSIDAKTNSSLLKRWQQSDMTPLSETLTISMEVRVITAHVIAIKILPYPPRSSNVQTLD